DRWEHGELAEAARACSAAIAVAEDAGAGTVYPPLALSEPAPIQPAHFEVEHNPANSGDRLHVLVDRVFDVAIIRTNEGVVVDVYPKGGFEAIASTYAFDSEVEQESSTN